MVHQPRDVDASAGPGIITIHDNTTVFKWNEISASHQISRTHDRYVTLSAQWFLFCQVTGLGSLVVTPVVGNLSDRYGRKALLALPAMASIVPLGTPRTTSYKLPMMHSEISELLKFVSFISSHLGVQPDQGVPLRVLHNQDADSDGLRRRHAMPLACLRGTDSCLWPPVFNSFRRRDNSHVFVDCAAIMLPRFLLLTQPSCRLTAYRIRGGRQPSACSPASALPASSVEL